MASDVLNEALTLQERYKATLKYAVSLQQAIEAHCRGDIAVDDKCTHHAEMLNKRLAIVEPVLKRQKYIRDSLNRYSDFVASLELPDVDADIKEQIRVARMHFRTVVEGLAN